MSQNISPLYFLDQIIIENTKGYSIITSGDIKINKNIEANSALIINTENSNSLSTGALRVSGGVSILQDLYLGGTANVSGNIKITNTSNSINTSTGSLLISGGVGIVENANIGGNITVQNGRPILPSSFGDIQETVVPLTVNSNDIIISGFIFPTGYVSSFLAIVSIIANGANLSAHYDIQGVKSSSGWVINQQGIGDIISLNIKFKIDNNGQIKYSCPDLTGFTNGSIKFRASTTTVDGIYTANTSGSIALNYTSEISNKDYRICTPLIGGSIGNIGMTIGKRRVYLGNEDQTNKDYPLDSDANHGGLILSGHKDHYFIYDMETESWLTSDNLNLECDTGIYICDNKVLDNRNLKLGDRLHPGEIYLGSGEHNTWKISVINGELSFRYRKLDGSWITKQTITLDNNDKLNVYDTSGNMISYYIEKRGEPLQDPITYTSSNGILSHDLRLSTDDTIVGGRIIKKSVNFEGTWPGPLFKVKPGDTLNLKLMNEIDDFGDLADWNIGLITEYRKHMHVHIDDDKQQVTWMTHAMPRGMVNLHFHGIHASSQGLGDNVIRMAKPRSSLQYSYPIPSDHPGGLYFYHPHSHGESMNMIGRGASGLIFIEGAYQERVNNAGIRRKIISFNRLNWKHEGTHDICSWYDYTAILPTDIYNPDANGVPQTLTTFAPEDFQGAYKFNTDIGKPGSCACGAGTTTRCAINGCKNAVGVIDPCPMTDIAWVPLLNGQIQPVISIQPGELQVWDYINTSTITFSRLAVEGHDLVLVGKDGVPRNISNIDLNSAPLDPDFVNVPAGVRLNYIINTSAQRFEFFVIPKSGITPINTDIYNILLKTVDQTELFFNDTEGQTPPAHDYLGNPIPAAGGALESDIIIGKLIYSGSTIASSASNHTSKISSLLPSITTDTTAIPQEDYKIYSYLFAQDYPTYTTDWKRNFNITSIINDGTGKIQIVFDNTDIKPRIKIDDRLNSDDPLTRPVITLTNTTNYNGTFNITSKIDDYTYTLDTNYVSVETSGISSFSFYTMEDHSINISNIIGTSNPTITCLEPHRLISGNPIVINNNNYIVNSIIDAYTFNVTTNVNLIGSTNILYQTINLKTEYFSHYSMTLPNLSNKITCRRKVWFAFNPNPTETGVSTWMDGGYYDENYRLQTHIDMTEEWLMQNYTEVIHVFHIHVNNYQICGYRDANFGYNVNSGMGYTDINGNVYTLNPVSTYSNDFLEKDIPFNGYEDSTSIPVAQGDPNATLAGVVNGEPGHRGEVRIRHKFKDYTGIFFMHCHLLDDQDMGMMKLVEICGPGYIPAPESSVIPDIGIITDYQNNPI